MLAMDQKLIVCNPEIECLDLSLNNVIKCCECMFSFRALCPLVIDKKLSTEGDPAN